MHGIVNPRIYGYLNYGRDLTALEIIGVLTLLRLSLHLLKFIPEKMLILELRPLANNNAAQISCYLTFKSTPNGSL